MATRREAPPVTLAEARDAAALNVGELAEQAQVSIGTIWRIEHSLTYPLPRVRRAVARVVGREPAAIKWPRRQIARSADAAADE